MPEPVAVYRFTRPVTLLLWQDDKYRLTQLPEESIISVGNLKVDANRMIQGTYRGDKVLLFSVDLEERAELLLSTVDLAALARNGQGGDGSDDVKQGSTQRDSEINPVEVAQRVADELLGRGHLAFVLKPSTPETPKKRAGSQDARSDDDLDDARQRPLGRCS